MANRRTGITVHDDFAIASNPGSEREVMERVAQVVARLGIDGIRLERLKTAVAEAAMNAIEHGNKGNPDIPVEVQVTSTARSVVVRIADRGGMDTIPEAEAPDIEAKLAGQQKARGWGLFLIEKMVDEVRTENDGVRHAVELVMHRGGGRVNPFEAVIRSSGDKVVVDMSGLLDRSADEALGDAFGRALASGSGTIVLNFTEVEYINSTGIGLVVTSLARARAVGRDVKAYGLTEHYREIFTITRLADFMGIYDDESAAVA